MRKHKKIAVPGSKCPYCGTVYRHEGMARRCLRGPLCRIYNNVTGDRRKIADIQFKAAACVQFFAAPLLKCGRDDSDYREIKQHAQRCLDLIDSLYTRVITLRCGMVVFDASTIKAARLLESIWPPVRTDMTHLLAVMSTLFYDVRRALGEAWQHYPAWDTDDVWAEIEKETDILFDLFNPEGTEDYPHIDKVMPAYDTLREFILPERKTDMRLYLAGERFWIAAPTKAEAREILRTETGLVGLPVKGIDLGEKLEDGRTAGELLATANGIPKIVARAA